MIPLSGNNLWFGIVEDVNDPMNQGRLKIRIIGIHNDDKSLVPTSALPWTRIGMPITSASISGVGETPVGIVQGTMVAGFFLDPVGQQESIALWSIPGARQFYLNPSKGFNDPLGQYPINGSQTDFNERGSNIDIQDNPMENNDPINEDVNDSDPPSTVVVPDVNGKYFTLEDFFMGRDKAYPNDLTQSIVNNATTTTNKVNQLLSIYYSANPNAPKIKVNSGWRPPAINSSTPGAATRSKHMTGQAVDISDTNDGILDKWCQTTTAGKQALEQCGLYMESLNATARWAHFQTVSPASGSRVFNP